MNKRDRRRLEREKEFGPQRSIITLSSDLAVLECGHEIKDPPRSVTVFMRLPKFYRCLECKHED